MAGQASEAFPGAAAASLAPGPERPGGSARAPGGSRRPAAGPRAGERPRRRGCSSVLLAAFGSPVGTSAGEEAKGETATGSCLRGPVPPPPRYPNGREGSRGTFAHGSGLSRPARIGVFFSRNPLAVPTIGWSQAVGAGGVPGSLRQAPCFLPRISPGAPVPSLRETWDIPELPVFSCILFNGSEG